MQRFARLVTTFIVAMSVAVLTGLAGAAEEKTLKGSFLWTDSGKAGDLEAIFTPTGEGTWDVAFHFKWSGEQHVYSGKAEGSLSAGALKGKVQNEGKNRTFTFAGSFNEGQFKGTHAELNGDKEHETGTLKLKS